MAKPTKQEVQCDTRYLNTAGESLYCNLAKGHEGPHLWVTSLWKPQVIPDAEYVTVRRKAIVAILGHFVASEAYTKYRFEEKYVEEIKAALGNKDD